MTRSCRRNACLEPATASLTFRYDTAQVWLDDLAIESEPQRWDLCPEHAGSLTVPSGWALVDVRTAAGREGPAPEVVRQAPSVPRHNRYAELSARLPALAAEFASELLSRPEDSEGHGPGIRSSTTAVEVPTLMR